MSTIEIIFGLVFFSPLLLAILYTPAIQYERGGAWLAVIPFFTIPALIVDVIFNLTWVTLIYRDLPFKNSEFLGRPEITYSDRLERFIDLPGTLGAISGFIAKWLNIIAPSKKHIRRYQDGISK